jgi:hypothetical protein
MATHLAAARGQRNGAERGKLDGRYCISAHGGTFSVIFDHHHSITQVDLSLQDRESGGVRDSWSVPATGHTWPFSADHRQAHVQSCLSQESKTETPVHISLRSVLIVLGIVCAGMPGDSRACNVPAFRYALERWPADAYQVLVYHRAGPRGAAFELLQKGAAEVSPSC